MAKVKVFSTPVCPWCHKAKQFLKDNNVEFEDINVAENKEGAKEMVEKSKQMAVPVIEVDGQIIIGYDELALKKALNLK